MDKANFDFLLDRVQPLIIHGKNHVRPISSLERLALTIRYLASGNSQVSLAIESRISPSSVCIILRETIDAIIKVLKPDFLVPPTEPEWKQIAERFFLKWNFPNVCGSIDRKHIRIKAPPASGSLYYNYKSFFSIVLLAIADAEFKFSVVDIGSYGSESDGGILAKSQIGKQIHAGSFGIPPPKEITPNSTPLPHVMLGDGAFALKPFMMRPYKANHLHHDERIFNYRLSRARMTVENSFGILAARWGIFYTAIEADVTTVKKIVLASVLLHNFLISRKDLNTITPDREGISGSIIAGNWRYTTINDSGTMSISRQGSNNYSGSAAEVRDAFKNYFVSDQGKVSWQDDMIRDGR